MKIYDKLFALQNEVEAISKNSKNPFFKSNYFDINELLKQVKPLLQKHELLLVQPIHSGMVASIIIDPETGDKIESAIELGSFSDPQKLGSAITYYRRYTLQSLLALQAEDDDANKASNKTKSKPALKPDTEKWMKAVHSLAGGAVTLSFVKDNYHITPDDLKRLELEFQQVGGEV